MANPLRTLNEFGQSVWLDFVSRDLLKSGGLARLIAEDGLRGVTRAEHGHVRAGLVRYTTKLLPSKGLSSRSVLRVHQGPRMMSYTSSLWYHLGIAARSLSGPKRHFNHQYGECSACA